jgi:hypothetical protein
MLISSLQQIRDKSRTGLLEMRGLVEERVGTGTGRLNDPSNVCACE